MERNEDIRMISDFLDTVVGVHDVEMDTGRDGRSCLWKIFLITAKAGDNNLALRCVYLY